MNWVNKPSERIFSVRTALALVVILIWSVCFVVIKVSYHDAPPLLYGALRALLGGLALLMIATPTGKFLPPRQSWGWIAALGATNTTLGLSGMFLSVGAVGAAIPAVLVNSQALFVAPFAMLFFREALTAGRLVGLLVGTGGVLLVVSGSHLHLGSMEGGILAVMAMAGLAAGNLIMKHIGKRVNALSATAWQYVLGGMLLMGWSVLSEEPMRVAWSLHFVAGLLFLGLVGSGLASWLWYLLLRQGELISINSLTLLTPVFGLVLALLIYGERLSKLSALGIGMVLGGVIWASRPYVFRNNVR